MDRRKYILAGIGGLAVAAAIVGIAVIAHVTRDLPSLEAIQNYAPALVTTVYSEDGKMIAEFSQERRKILKFEEIPPVVIDAFTSAEDDQFFSHRGINPLSILRAAFKMFRAGGAIAGGGSTITQQVAKNLLLTPEKSFSRKIKEALLAFRIENALTKQEIITLYLTHIFLGSGAYGVESAARTYFGKSTKDITIPEAAVLAGLPQAPSKDNPLVNPKASKMRQEYVLSRMLETRKISREQYDEAKKTPLSIRNKRAEEKLAGPYFVEHVRRYLTEKYGADKVLSGGLKVYTTMNIEAQKAAEAAINAGLQTVDKRIGLRKPKKHLKDDAEIEAFLLAQHKEIQERSFEYKILAPDRQLLLPPESEGKTFLEVGKNYEGVFVGLDKARSLKVRLGKRHGFIKLENYRWALYANPEDVFPERTIRDPSRDLKVGDVITVQPKQLGDVQDEYVLEQDPLVQGALLSYRIPDGALLAMVGGYDFYVTHSEFNRSYQAVRQPGSTFKAYIYACALDSGLTPSTLIVDSPIVYRDNDEKTQVEKVWKPGNFGERFYGDTLLRTAITHSRNIPTIKLLQYLKIANVVEYAKKLGVKSPLAEDLSLALGSSGLTLEEQMRAWGVFANRGERLNNHFILKVVDREGTILEEFKAPPAERVIPETTAFLATSLLRSVVENGTGQPVKELGRPVAGKTGTTNDFKDALFLGYIPQMITGVWIGFDEDRPLGHNETGGIAAAPIWLSYMKKATADVEAKDFDQPAGIIQSEIDAETGDVPTARTRKKIKEFYVDGSAPGQKPENKNVVITGNASLSGGGVQMTLPGQPGAAGSSLPKAPEAEGGADDFLRDDL